MEAQVAHRGAVGPDRRLVVAVVVAEQMHPRAEPVGLQAQAAPEAQQAEQVGLQAQMGLQVPEERATPEVVAAELQHQAVRLVPRGNRSPQRRPETQVPAAPGAQMEGELGHPILAVALVDGPLHRAAEEAPEAHLAAHRTSQVGAELARRLGNRAGRNQDSARAAPVEPEEPGD